MENWSTGNKGDSKEFTPHPEGVFAAVCVDVFTKEGTNPYYGQVNKFTGEVDNRQTVTKACIAFLTQEYIEVDGVNKPRYTSFWAGMSWHEKSKLRGFVAKWMPMIGANDSVNPEQLIGKHALVTVEQYTRRDGKVGHSVSAAMGLPPAMASFVPAVPADFVRQKGKPARDEQAAPAKVAPVAPAQDEPNDLPF